MKRFSIHCFAILAAVALCHQSALAQDAFPIDSIIKARITADGNVSGRATDFLINLGIPRDNSDGMTLREGERIEIVLPPEFVNDRQVVNSNTGKSAAVGTETVFTSNSCTIGNFWCNTSVFVQGWPQRPIANVLPTANRNSPDDFAYVTPVYLLSQGDTGNVFVHEAARDVGPGSPPPGPGIKQVHMILPGFTNPTVAVPTDFSIMVRHTRKDGNGEYQVVQEGTAPLTILPEVEPSINLTSVFDAARHNTVYQEIALGETPLPYEFYMWNGDGGAYTGVSIAGADVLDDLQRKIGRVTITGPNGAIGQGLASAADSTVIVGGDVFFNRDTARLTAQFTPGNLPGNYVTTIEMFSKNDIGIADPAIVSTENLTVHVVPEPSTWLLLGIGSLALVALARRRGVA